MAPPAAMAHMSFQMRATARFIHSSSVGGKADSPVIAGVLHELADELHHACDDSEDQPRDVEPGGFELLIGKVAEAVTDRGAAGRDERQGGVGACQQ